VSNAFRDYTIHGPAEAGPSRGAAVADLGLGVVAGILLWPFPVVRLALESLMGSAALGWAVHVPLLFAFALLVAWAYCTICAVLLHRTVGMYFADLGFVEPPTPSAAIAFAASWVGAGVAGLPGQDGPAGRVAARWLRSTRA